jgi:hypothetical protein
MVLLVTSDNEQFTVEKDVAERSVLIKNMLEGPSTGTDNALITAHFAILLLSLRSCRCRRERSAHPTTQRDI